MDVNKDEMARLEGLREYNVAAGNTAAVEQIDQAIERVAAGVAPVAVDTALVAELAPLVEAGHRFAIAEVGK